ncbi:MAG: hypothetical protein N2441_02995 [Rhodocyclaceae bacterium]|nr:hypothetical protein [Rhodocyclaceae bacterium]
MFLKIVLVLLLLIVLASLLAPRAPVLPPRQGGRLRVLMLRIALVLLGVVTLVAAWHYAG